MAGRLSLDTSILIDLQRELRRGDVHGPAHLFLEFHATAATYVTVTALGEFASGFADPAHPQVAAISAAHEIIPTDEAVALKWSELQRQLRLLGAPIGANDLWIAAASLCHDLPVVTANAEHFKRVPDLRVMDYR